MVDLTEGMRVSVVKTYSEFCVVKAKKGQVGVVEGFTTKDTHIGGIPTKIDVVSIRLTNDTLVEIPPNHISPYKKQERTSIETLSDEALVDHVITLSAHEVQTKHGSGVHKKMLKDIERCRIEILNRMKR